MRASCTPSSLPNTHPRPLGGDAVQTRAKVLASNVSSQHAHARVLFVNVARSPRGKEPGSTYPSFRVGGDERCCPRAGTATFPTTSPSYRGAGRRVRSLGAAGRGDVLLGR